MQRESAWSVVIVNARCAYRGFEFRGSSGSSRLINVRAIAVLFLRRMQNSALFLRRQLHTRGCLAGKEFACVNFPSRVFYSGKIFRDHRSWNRRHRSRHRSLHFAAFPARFGTPLSPILPSRGRNPGGKLNSDRRCLLNAPRIYFMMSRDAGRSRSRESTNSISNHRPFLRLPFSSLVFALHGPSDRP